MAPDASRRFEPLALGPVALARLQELFGNDAVLDYLFAVVNVVYEKVERVYPLLEPLFESLPFTRLYDPRDYVEREYPLGPLLLAVDGERHPHLEEPRLGGLLPPKQLPAGELF